MASKRQRTRLTREQQLAVRRRQRLLSDPDLGAMYVRLSARDRHMIDNLIENRTPAREVRRRLLLADENRRRRRRKIHIPPNFPPQWMYYH